MKKQLTLGVMVFGLLFVSACGTVALDATNLSESVSVNNTESKPYTVLESFKVNDKAGWAIGFIPANKPAGDKHDYFETMLSDIIQRADGDAIINLKVRSQGNFGDFLITVATGGLYTTRTVTISGDVIKYK